MKIVFDGLERCGKTTQIKLLKDIPVYKNFTVYHDKGPGKNATFTETADYIRIQIDFYKSAGDIIYDRFVFSDIVWGKIFRKYDSTKEIFDFYGDWWSCDTLYYFIFTDSFDNIAGRIDPKNLVKTKKHYDAIMNGYLQLYRMLRDKFNVNVHIIDIACKDIDFVHRQVRFQLGDIYDKLLGRLEDATNEKAD
jgi:thymidylate kinase